MIDRDYTQWKIERIIKDINDGKINLSPAYQRGDVWSETAKKKLITTILFEGYPIPPIMLSNRQTHINTIDGKQRCTTLCEFMDNLFPIEFIENGESKKQYYKELSEKLRAQFDLTNIPVQIYYGMTDIDECKAYERLNRGTVMKSGEIIKSYMYCDFANIVNEYGNQDSYLVKELQCIWDVKFPSMDKRYNNLAMLTGIIAGLMKGTSFTSTSYRILEPLLNKDKFDVDEINILKKNINRFVKMWKTWQVTLPTEWKKAAKIWKIGHLFGYMIHSLWTEDSDKTITHIWEKFITACCTDTTIYKKWEDAINIPNKNINPIRLNRGWELIKLYYETNQFEKINTCSECGNSTDNEEDDSD